MLSGVLNSELAIKMSVRIIETFVLLRRTANNYEEIVNKIHRMESQNNDKFSDIYQVLQRMLSKSKEDLKSKSRPKIGYKK